MDKSERKALLELVREMNKTAEKLAKLVEIVVEKRLEETPK